MSGKEETRIFVGGLSWDTTERHLEDAFSRFGKVVEAQVSVNTILVSVSKILASLLVVTEKIMLERDTGRPRGFGFVTFSDSRGMERAIDEMHGHELGGRVISVNKAEPKLSSDEPGYGSYRGGGRGYSSGGGRGGGGFRSSGDGPPSIDRSECFKCGRLGHWARECPSSGGGGSGGRGNPRAQYGKGGGRGDRFGGGDRYGDRYNDRYVDDRYDGGGRYGDRDRVDSRDRYAGGRDRYIGDRYPTGNDYYANDRYGVAERFPPSGYGKERGYEKDVGGPRGISDRYGGGGPARYDGGYRDRPGPYDRPSRGGAVRPSFDDRYP